MPTNGNTKQQEMGNQSTAKRVIAASSFRKSMRKAPGTRLGTLQDWRAANNNSGKTFGRHGCTIRDGR